MVLALQQGQLHQALVGQTEQRRAQRARQRQVVLRRHQHVEQRHHVQHFAAVDELGFLAHLRRNVQRAQLVLQRQQSGALAREDHHVLGAQSGADLF